jgi:DNA-binding MarR family transcriptional regulator
MQENTRAAVRCMAAAIKVVRRIENLHALQVFLHIAENPGATLSDIGEALDLPRSTVSRYIATLSQHRDGLDLVQMGQAEADRRARPLELTRDGLALIRQMARVFNRDC